VVLIIRNPYTTLSDFNTEAKLKKIVVKAMTISHVVATHKVYD
jgi:hypothetical protein